MSTQNSSKNAGVFTTFSEKRMEINARQIVENDVAFNRPQNSMLVVDNLLASYNPHAENTMWQSKSAPAKIPQLDSFTRIERNCASGTLCCADATKNVVIPKHRNTNATSNSLSAFKKNLRFTLLTGSL